MDLVKQPLSVQKSLSPEREVGLLLLHQFVSRVPAYSAKRNYDVPGERHVSGLSPYIRYRLVRESEVVKHVLDHHSYSTCAKFIEEVAWRTYWKGYLEARPSIWTSYVQNVRNLTVSLDERETERLQQARHGETGISCFDHWVYQLKSMGWLHNHARMWFASIWIFTLRLPWELGAAFFLEHLLDGDPASNTLSWRWVAGLHTKGKHYIAKAHNIKRYTDGLFFPEGQLNESPEPLTADEDYDQKPLSSVNCANLSGFPSLSQCPAGLLVCPEELTPELGPLEDCAFSSFCVLNARDVMAVTGAVPSSQSFINGAIRDTAVRMANHWSAKIARVETAVPLTYSRAMPSHVGSNEDPRVYVGCVDKWVDSVVAWAVKENPKSVWMIQPPVGPWKDFLPLLRVRLRNRNICLFEYRNRWDTLNWPHAISGYFKFRKGLIFHAD